MKRGLYDGTLQMFVEEPREVDLRWLGFLRWLVERARIENAEIHGPSGGPYAERVLVESDHNPLPMAA